MHQLKLTNFRIRDMLRNIGDPFFFFFGGGGVASIPDPVLLDYNGLQWLSTDLLGHTGIP